MDIFQLFKRTFQREKYYAIASCYTGRGVSKPFPLFRKPFIYPEFSPSRIDRLLSFLLKTLPRKSRPGVRTTISFNLSLILAGFVLVGSVSLAARSRPDLSGKSESGIGLDPMEQCKGWRVQLESFISEQEARSFVDSLRYMMNVEISTLYRDESYKVQVGSFEEQLDAAKFRDFLREIGFNDAWIVECRILAGGLEERVIEQEEPVSEPPAPKIERIPRPVLGEIRPQIRIGDGYNGWRVQIMALYESPRSHADEVALNAQAFLGMGTEVFRSVKAYKVRAGKFPQKGEAKAELKRVHLAGYWDAYIVDNDIVTE